MLMRRVTAPGASLVCKVDSTRWPVSAAWIAVTAVSRSRISPTITTSGSCRSSALSARAKLIPIRSWVWICVMPERWYSTGSSTVETFIRRMSILRIEL